MDIIIFLVFLIVFNVAILISWRFHETILEVLLKQKRFSRKPIFIIMATGNVLLIIMFIVAYLFPMGR